MDDRCEAWVGTYGHGEGFAFDSALNADGTLLFVTGFADKSSKGYGMKTVAFDARTGRKRWTSMYTGRTIDADEGSAIAVSHDGKTVYVTGRKDFRPTGCPGRECSDVVTLAYAARTGKRLWSAVYDGPAHAQDLGVGIAVAPDGSALYVLAMSEQERVCGGGNATLTPDYVTIAYRTRDGDRRWTDRYDGPRHCGDRPTGIAAGGNGLVYVTGSSAQGPVDDLDFLTIAYKGKTGRRVWGARREGGYCDDEPVAIAVSPRSHRVYLTGESGPNEGECWLEDGGEVKTTSYLTAAYSARKGKLLWASRFSAESSVSGIPMALAVTRQDRVLVTGLNFVGSFAVVTGEGQAVTVAYEGGSGKQLWGHVLSTGASSGNDIAVAPSGQRAFVAAGASGLGRGSESATIAFDVESGNVLWSARYGTRDDESIRSAAALGISAGPRRVHVLASAQRFGSPGDDPDLYPRTDFALTYRAGS